MAEILYLYFTWTLLTDQQVARTMLSMLGDVWRKVSGEEEETGGEEMDAQRRELRARRTRPRQRISGDDDDEEEKEDEPAPPAEHLKRARSPEDDGSVDIDIRRPVRRRRHHRRSDRISSSSYGEQPMCVGIRTGNEEFVRPKDVLQKIERANELLRSDPCILSTGSQSTITGIQMPKGKTKSASETMIANGRIGDSRVVVKIALDAAQDNALEFERWVYTNVTNSLVVNGYSPHIPFVYGDLACPTDSKVFRMLKDITGAATKSEGVHYLVAEYGGASLSEQRKSLGEDDVLSIMFQVLWTLRCFQDVGLMHNDLHIGNVLLMRRPMMSGRWSDMNYRMDDRRGNVWKFTLPAPTYMAKIFDFDRSSKVATPYSSCKRANTSVADGSDLSDAFGQREGFTERFDLFTFMYGLWAAGGVIRHTVETLLGPRNARAMFNASRMEQFGHPGLPCVNRRMRRCAIEIPSERVLPPLSVLISVVADEISRRRSEKGRGLLSLFAFTASGSEQQVYLLPSSVKRSVTNLTKPLADFGGFMNRLRETEDELRAVPRENFIVIDDVMYLRDVPSMENPGVSEVEERLKRTIAKGVETANSLLEAVRAAGLGSRAALHHADQLTSDLLFMQQLAASNLA